MRVSVIIPSYRGARKLPNVLKALSRQTYPGFEVVVALDGSADDSLAVLAGAEKSPGVVIKDYPNQSRKSAAGIEKLAAVRNSWSGGSGSRHPARGFVHLRLRCAL